ncbi:UNVERIFIED_CONTAM: hypothetical protein GTU68_018240 [Idotea baltica]|nr:hypothetical protein [Idotea baltica]
MGIKILWLMPIFPIGEKNRKGSLGSYYSIKDYKNINPDYGTKADFDALVKDAHARGMYVILDWVANHTAWDHPWTVDHPSWYSKDYNGQSPTTPFDDQGNPTDWTDVADLNFDMPDMRKSMTDQMMYWVDNHNIDGFRCDMAHFVPLDYWQQAIPTIKSARPNLFMLAECESPEYVNQGGFDANYGWEMHHLLNAVAQNKSPSYDFGALQHRINQAYKPGYIKMNFITNHDENSWNGTVQERMGTNAQAAAVFTFTFDGLPLIYSGQERGLNKRLKFFEKDIINWDGENYEGFYSSLINLKKSNSALAVGDQSTSLNIINTDNNVMVFTRSNQDNQVLVMLNFNSIQQQVTIPEHRCNHTPKLNKGIDGHFHTGDQVILPPGGYLVFDSSK